MKIRRFYSSSMRGALKQVADTFGPEAAILSNRKIAGGVEVVAALDYDESLIDRDEDVTHHGTSALQPPEASMRQGAEARIGADSGEGLKTSDETEIQSQMTPDEPRTKHSQAPSTRNQAAAIEWGVDPGIIAMKEELGLMRSMISEQLKGIAWSRLSEQNPTRAMLMRKLSQLGIDSRLHAGLLEPVNTQGDAECIWQSQLAVLAKALPISSRTLLHTGGVFAFMGPAGVGKTTTIAKLAARHIIKYGRESVALVTTDRYRISAQEQLSTFARLLQVQAYKVSSKNTLKSILAKCAGKRLVLIDTAGMSGRDTHLAAQFEELEKADTQIQRVLLLSAACQLASLRHIIEMYEPYSPQHIILTKVDEAASLGDSISALLETNIPLMYTCDGQRVPEDIRTARSHQLVAKAVWLANKFAQPVDDWKLAQQSADANHLARSA